MKKYDIAVIGGGAAGLAAAISAKRTNERASVAVIERLPKTGKKILATGNGRCNFSNTAITPDKYVGTCKGLVEVTKKFSVEDFLYSLGVICENDGEGRLYPRCRSASSVLDALRLECAKLGVEEICGTEITDIQKKKRSSKTSFELTADNETITSERIILAGGGKSQPALGSNGSVLDLCKRSGIKVIDFFPALVPLTTDTSLVKPLKGQRADATVMFFSDGRCIKSERGEVQFADGVISGICVFDLSYLFEMRKDRSELRIDLLPDISETAVAKLLKNMRQIRSTASAEDMFSGIFTRPLAAYVIKRSLGRPPKKASDFDDNMLRIIAKVIKSLSFPITGTAGFERSQVSGGGIISDEINDTFELKKIQGTYACGELLDIYGRCGGYNLDFAFSSGALAGKHAASSLLNKK